LEEKDNEEKRGSKTGLKEYGECSIVCLAKFCMIDVLSITHLINIFLLLPQQINYFVDIYQYLIVNSALSVPASRVIINSN
jgi:hypothetical protein